MNKIKKSDHFYLIDGSGYIFRAYYALPPLTRKSDGMPTGAVNGFCNMLYKLLEDSKSKDNLQKPTHFAVIFDSARKNFRNDIYRDYKANRSDAPEDLIPQFDLIRKSVKAFNLPSIEMLNYEADDLIATYSEQILQQGAKVTIVSSDKDLMQLFKKNVRIYDPMKNKFISEDDIENKFGVRAEKVIDVQALAGDSSDNVPGVPGIGVKTAAELINKYGSLEKLLLKAEEIKQNKRRETILDNKDKAIISKKLVTLKKDVPTKNNINEFELKNINKEKLYNFLREMEFNRLLSQVISFYGETENKSNVKERSSSKFDKEYFKNYKLIKSLDEIDFWIKKAEERGEIAIDTETSSLDPQTANLLGISLCFEAGEACYIPIGHEKNVSLDKEKVIKKVKNLFEDPSIKKIGQNIKFDFIVLYHHGIFMTSMEDTMLMSYTLDAGKNRHNMDTLSEIHLNHKTISYKDIVGTGKKQIMFNEVEISKAKDYAAEDADVTYRLFKIFEKNLKNENLKDIYEIFEKPLIKILAVMEINGVKVNSKVLEDLSKKFQKKIKLLEKQIYKISKKEFNIGSTKQLGEVLYNELKISALKKTKKGSFATGASVMEDLAYKGHELPKLILEWRQLSKLKNTYSDSLPGYLNKKTKRVHTSFLLAATSTGRLASSDPNLQNIPIKTEDGNNIRKSFIAEKNNLLVSADYNQIEMRILADLADVKELKKAFKNNEDIHTLTASQVFNIDIKKVDSDKRRKAKAINFGIIYGISAFGLSQQLDIPITSAKDFIDSYFRIFPKIQMFMEDTSNKAMEDGHVTTMFGRKRPIAEFLTKNKQSIEAGKRIAINTRIQGTAAEIIKIAMNSLHKFLQDKQLESRLILQVHDELIFEMPSSELNHIIYLKEIMEKVCEFEVPIVCDVELGNNWGDLENYPI